MKNTETEKKKKIFSGRVVSVGMKDTIVVAVSRFFRHQRYGKFIKIQKRIKAHDPGNLTSLGEEVTIEETRPISKDKHFKVKR